MLIHSKPFDLDRTVRLCIGLAVAVGLFALTKELSSVLLPFIIALFLAYLIQPLVLFFRDTCRLKNNTLSLIVALIVLVAFVAGIIAILVPLVGAEVDRMGVLVNQYMAGFDAQTVLSEEWQDRIREWLKQIDIKALLSKIDIEAMAGKITSSLGGLIGGGMSIVSGIGVALICLLYTIFILVDYDAITQGLRDIVPPKFRHVVYGLFDDLEAGMSKYFRGQAAVASTVGILFSIGFLIMGLPLAVVVGLFIGLLNMVPYLQVLGIPITMVLGILQSMETGTPYWIILTEIAAVFLIVQAIQDMVLNPLIMGNVIGMNPAIMLLSLSIFGYLFGVLGMIIALPVTTVIISYYKRYVLGEEPTAAPPGGIRLKRRTWFNRKG